MSVAAGVTLIVVSIVLGIIGLFTLIFGIGFLILFLALILFVLGVIFLAQGDPARLPPGYYAMHSMPPQYAPAYPGYPPYPTPMMPPPAPYAQGVAPGVPSERFCPVCGTGNLRASAFCARCGRPLPPPP